MKAVKDKEIIQRTASSSAKVGGLHESQKLTSESSRENQELIKLKGINEATKKENNALKATISSLEKELEIYNSKGGAKTELIQLRAAYNELETKYNNAVQAHFNCNKRNN